MTRMSPVPASKSSPFTEDLLAGCGTSGEAPLSVFLIAQEFGPAIGSLLGSGLLNAARDRPHMSVGIHDPRRAITPELILRWNQNLRAALNCGFHSLIHVRHI